MVCLVLFKNSPCYYSLVGFREVSVGVGVILGPCRCDFASLFVVFVLFYGRMLTVGVWDSFVEVGVVTSCEGGGREGGRGMGLRSWPFFALIFIFSFRLV